MNNLSSLVTGAVSVLSIMSDVHAETLFVYFGTAADGIYRSEFNTATGSLGASSRIAPIQNPGFLALHPDGDKLYAVGNLKGGPGVAGYEIAPTGELNLITEALIGDGGGAHVAVHPSGAFLLTAQYSGGSVALFPLDEAGRIGTATLYRHTGSSGVVPDRQASPHPHFCGFSPDARFALVPDLGLDQMVIYRVDLTDPNDPGLTLHGTADSVPGGGPRHLRFSRDGTFIFLLNELSLSTTTFAWSAENGTARRLHTVEALSEVEKAKESFNSAAEILVHPNGRFVYSSNRGHDSVTVYHADRESGKLKVVQVQPIRGAFPRHINLSPNGDWLLAAGAHSNTISVHRVHPKTGQLTYQTGGVIQVPSPICVLFATPPPS